MNDLTYETLIDRRVQARLATDRRYLHAENAEQASLVEAVITVEQELALLRIAAPSGDESVRRQREAELEQQLSEAVDELLEAGVAL